MWRPFERLHQGWYPKISSTSGYTPALGRLEPCTRLNGDTSHADQRFTEASLRSIQYVYIDHSIEPTTIPRTSYSNLRINANREIAQGVYRCAHHNQISPSSPFTHCAQTPSYASSRSRTQRAVSKSLFLYRDMNSICRISANRPRARPSPPGVYCRSRQSRMALFS